MMSINRRSFLGILGATALDATFARRAWPHSMPGAKPLRGIFVIGQTPFTAANQLDVKTLGREVEFADHAGIHGFVWPQLASEYSTLSKAERMSGMEAIAGAGKNLRPAIVMGVQAPEVQTAVEYARHAEKLGADAVISLPPATTDDDALLAYYREVGQATQLPLFVQSTGKMSVELVVRMYNAIPTLRYVKDEAGGSPLGRIGQLRAQTGDKLKIFTGNHSRTLIDEMQRGCSGSMPAAAFGDIYAGVWDLWHSGNQVEAIDLFQKAMLLVPEVEVYGITSLKYLLYLRGVFPTYEARVKDGRAPLDDSGKKVLRELAKFANPYFKCCAVAGDAGEGGLHD